MVLQSIDKLKVFVTGGCGYVGSLLIPTLIKKGCYVTVLDKMIFGNTLPKENCRLKVIRGDIRDTELVKKLVVNQDAVIHLAFINHV